MNYGSFVANSTNSSAPFVQLLSTTNATTALADFNAVRNPKSSFGTRDIVAVIVFGVFLLILFIFGGIHYRRRRAKRSAKPMSATVGAFFKPNQPYQQLHEPAPQAPIDLHVLDHGNTAYAPVGPDGYQSHARSDSQFGGYNPYVSQANLHSSGPIS
jgi:hypothetical protein